MFQPGEEGYGGAKDMLDEGLLDIPTGRTHGPVEAAFAIHIGSRYPTGAIRLRAGAQMASSDVLRITVEGKGGHASAPHLAVDPITVAAEIVLALQVAVTRGVDPFDPAVITIAKVTAGTTNNIIPETAELLGTIRTVSEETRAAVKERVKALVEGICSAYGATGKLDIQAGYPVTANDDAFAAFVLDVARDLVGREAVEPLKAPIMGAEDFSYVLQKVPGAMAFLGAVPAGTRPGDGAAEPLEPGRLRRGSAAGRGRALRRRRPAPPRRRVSDDETRADLRRRLAEVPRRLAVATRAAADKPTAAGEWTPAEVVRHLIAVEEEVWHSRLRQLAAEDRPRWPWTEPDRWLGAPDASLEDLLIVYADRRGTTIAILGELDDAGWARTGEHATYGVLDVAALMAKAIDHDDEHLDELPMSPEPVTRSTRLAANAAAIAVVAYAILWFATTQVRSIREVSPFAEDPWDAVASYAAIFLPMVAGATWIRSLRHRGPILPPATAARI